MTDANQPHGQPSGQAAISLESLETRQLMSGATLDKGVLTVTGLQFEKNTIRVGVDSGKVHAVVNGKDSAFTLADVKSITINGSTAADTVKVDSTVKVPVRMSHVDPYDAVTGIAGVTSPSPSPTVSAIQLVNTDTGKPVAGYENLSGSVTLDPAKLPAHYTLAATLSAKGQIRFDYDGKSGYRLESVSPYSFSGDVDGAYRPFTLSTGTHTLTVNSVTSGKVLSSKTVTLKVLGQATTPTKPTTPAPTTTKPTVPAPTPVATPVATPSDAAAPVAAITAVNKTVPAGTAVHVDALASTLETGTWSTGHYAWDFGDAGSAQNVMRGFNAAHLYDKPGTYAVKLTVTNESGKSSTTTLSVTVTAASRKTLYVSNDGSDSNSGLSQNSPLKSVAKAMSLVEANTQVLFQRGDTFAMTAGTNIAASNVVIGAYGMGARPTIDWTGARDTQTMFHVLPGVSNVTIENLSFDSVFDHDTDDTGLPIAVKPGGTNFTARGNEFLNLQSAFVLNENPTGVLLLNNTAPLETGLRKYFAWVQGSGVTIAGNKVANSTREHIVRANYVSKMNCSDNDFTNLDRVAKGDKWDPSKTAMNAQSGEFAYLYNNKIHSEFSMGPLGEQDGLNSKQLRFKYIIAEGNETWDGQMLVNHGSDHVTLRENVVHNDGAIGYNIEGYNGVYGRGVTDVVLQHNTAVNYASTGSFATFGSTDGVRMTDNLYVAPNLTVGSYGTAAVKMDAGALKGRVEIDGNVWPVAKTIVPWLGENAINLIGGTYDAAGLKTAAEWNGLSYVGDDVTQNVTPIDSYSVTLNGVRVGAKLAA